MMSATADTGNNGLEAFVVDGFRHDSCSRRPVTSHIARFAGHLAHHASTHVFELIGEFDFTSYSHAVFRDGW